MADESIRYRILIADDNENDSRLIKRQLERSQLACEFRVAKNREEYIAAVETFSPDLVLSDFRFPSFSGTDAIRILHEALPDVPIIAVTGTLGDELAAGLIQEGAADYVLKNNLERLPAAVRRTIYESERKRQRERAEKEAAAQQARLARLFERSMDGILVLGHRGEVLDANPAAALAFGYEPDELIGMRWADLVESANNGPFPPSPTGVAEEQSRRLYRSVRRDGSIIDLDVALAEEQEEDEVFAYAIFRDVTKELADRAALRREQQLQGLMLEIAHDTASAASFPASFVHPMELLLQFVGWHVAHLYVYDFARGVLVSSRVWAGGPLAKLGPFRTATEARSFASNEGLVGRALAELSVSGLEDLSDSAVYLRSREAVDAGLKSVLAFPVIAENQPAAVIEMYSWDNADVDQSVRESLTLLGHEMGRLFERKWFEERIRRRQTELESLVENAPDIIIRTDPEMRILLANSKISLFGLSPAQVVGEKLDELGERVGIPFAVIDRMRDLNGSLREAGRAETLEWSDEVDGTIMYFLTYVVPEFGASGEMVSALSITRDITEMKQTEESLRHSREQLEHAQRLESVGRLAGGVAHDFNNILTAINGYLHLARTTVNSESQTDHYLTNVASAAERAARLTHQLLLFSRRSPTEMTDVALNKIIVEITKMLSRLIGENIRLVTKLADQDTTIRCDPGKLEQVVMNLVINARDAMPDGGELRIETAAEQRVEVAGNFIRLSIVDAGIGMDETTKQRIFEPFFTTKSREHGTGLGMAVVYGIVQEHGGEIEVESSVGRGTAVHVYLPAAEGTDEQSGKDADAEEVTPVNAVLLLVEDDTAIREMLAGALPEYGLEVTTAGTISDAVELIQNGLEPDIVVTDVVLPDGSGATLPRRLAFDIPFVFSSGYLEDRSDLERLREMGHPFVQKPYNVTALVSVIEATLRGYRQ